MVPLPASTTTTASGADSSSWRNRLASVRWRSNRCAFSSACPAWAASISKAATSSPRRDLRWREPASRMAVSSPFTQMGPATTLT